MTRQAIFALGYAALILGLSSIPGRSLPAIALISQDKLIHIAEYFGFVLILSQALPGSRPILFAVILATLMGALDERYQLLIPGRESSLADWFADALGAVLGGAWQSWRAARA